MTLLQRYRQAEAQLARLLERRRRLAEDPSLQRDLEFEQRLLQLLAENRIDQVEALAIVRSALPRSCQQPAIRYRHPGTGEVLEDRGDSTARIAAWRLQYGEGTVASWKVQLELQDLRRGSMNSLARADRDGPDRSIPFTSV